MTSVAATTKAKNQRYESKLAFRNSQNKKKQQEVRCEQSKMGVCSHSKRGVDRVEGTIGRAKSNTRREQKPTRTLTLE